MSLLIFTSTILDNLKDGIEETDENGNTLLNLMMNLIVVNLEVVW